MIKGTVLVTLNVRPSPNGLPVLFQLRLGDKVEAENVNPEGWWKLSKVTRGLNNIPLPYNACYAQQGANNSYIRLDEIIVSPPPVTEDDPYVKAILVRVSGAEEIWLPQV